MVELWRRRRWRGANKQQQSRVAAQSMADTNASGCYSRDLREANTWKNQQTARRPRAVREGGMAAPAGHVSSGRACIVGPTRPAVEATRRAPGRGTASAALAIFSRRKGGPGACRGGADRPVMGDHGVI